MSFRPTRKRLVVIGLCAGLVGVPARAARAAAPPSIELDTVTAQYLTNARAEVGSAQAVVNRARQVSVAADTASAGAAAAFDGVSTRLSRLDASQRQASARLAQAHDRLRDFAVQAYVGGGIGTQLASLLSALTVSDFGRRRGVLDSVIKEGSDAVRAFRRERDRADRATLAIADEYQRATVAKEQSDRAAKAARFALDQASAALSERALLLRLVEAALPAGTTDIPGIVMAAYQHASEAVTARGCPLAWWAIAAIGRVESHHGHNHQAHLGANGDLLPPILGPALDGTNGTRAIPAWQGGKYTGDPTWDHAVGPMQFISSTWARWGADGNGDGVTDPNNVYDAALATALFLCAASPDVTSDAGLAAAYHAHNHSDAYVTEVLALSHAYRGR